MFVNEYAIVVRCNLTYNANYDLVSNKDVDALKTYYMNSNITSILQQATN